MRYVIIIEKSSTSYGAYVPNLPGCVAVGETPEEARILIEEAILGFNPARPENMQRTYVRPF
jgi:predicted RNase H-like HicB family nuclease